MSLVQNQYSNAISLVYASFEVLSDKHDVRRSMHFVVPLNGRRPVGNKVFTNAVNVSSAWSGPAWVAAQDSCEIRSVHAEARAAQQVLMTQNLNSRRARRRALRSSIGKADGMLVCRIADANETDIESLLRFSLPCSHCASILQRCGFSFVVYSTGDIDEPWKKITINQLSKDSRVQPVRRMRK